jgi:hypothetical protein
MAGGLASLEAAGEGTARRAGKEGGRQNWLTDVVEGVEDYVKLLHVRHAKLLVLDVAMVRCDLHVLVEAATPPFAVRLASGSGAERTEAPGAPEATGVRPAPKDGLGGDCCFALANVLAPEEELAVQVADIDGVQIDYLDFSEAR